MEDIHGVLDEYNISKDDAKALESIKCDDLYNLIISSVEDLKFIRPVIIRDFLWLSPSRLPQDVQDFCLSLDISREDLLLLLSMISYGFLVEENLTKGVPPPPEPWDCVISHMAKEWEIGVKWMPEDGKEFEVSGDGWKAKLSDIYYICLPLKEKKDEEVESILTFASGSLEADGKKHSLCIHAYLENVSRESLKKGLKVAIDTVENACFRIHRRCDEVIFENLYMLLSKGRTNFFKYPNIPLRINLDHVDDVPALPFRVIVGMSALLSLAWPVHVAEFTTCSGNYCDVDLELVPVTSSRDVGEKLVRYTRWCIMSVTGFEVDVLKCVHESSYRRNMLGVGSWYVFGLLKMLDIP